MANALLLTVGPLLNSPKSLAKSLPKVVTSGSIKLLPLGVHKSRFLPVKINCKLFIKLLLNQTLGNAYASTTSRSFTYDLSKTRFLSAAGLLVK